MAKLTKKEQAWFDEVNAVLNSRCTHCATRATRVLSLR